MPQPVSYNPGTPVSGSIQENSISYVVDGQQRNYRGGFGGLSWMSEVPAENNVIFIGNTTSIGKGPAGKPLFYPSYNNSSANIVYAANTLPGSPRNFTTTSSAYNWAVTNNFFINNSDNPIPRIDADGLGLYIDANQPSSYPQTGTSWYDFSGRNNNGTLVNGPTFDNGGYITFDGVDDYCSFPVNTFNSGAPQQGTFYIRMKFPTLNTVSSTILFYDGGVSSNLIYFYRNANFSLNGYSWLIYYNRTDSQDDALLPQLPYLPNTWYDTAFTFNSSGEYRVYVNGELKSLENASLFSSWKRTGANNPYLDPASLAGTGSIQLLQWYNRPLTQAEILQNYYQAPIVTNGLVMAVDADNLVSYESGSLIVYSMTGSYSGSLINGTGFTNSNGGAWNFDGVDDYIQMNNNASINSIYTNNQLTISSWFKYNDSGSFRNVMGILKNGDPTFLAFGWRIGNAGSFFFDSNINNTRITQQLIADISSYAGSYINATTTYTNGSLLSYINGVLVNSSNITGPIVDFTSNDFLIGASAGYGVFKGNIAPTFLYNRALSASEVQQNYQATKDKFQGQQIITQGITLYLDSANKDSYPGTGTTWYDLSGNGNNGTLVNGPSFLPNVNSGIFDFDGVDDYTSLGFSAASLIQGKTAVTIGIFFKLDVLADLRGLIGTLNYGCGANLGLVARGNVLTFYNDTGTCYDVGISSFVETGKWIYAVGTYDGTTTRIYGIKDGILSQDSGTGKSGATNTFTSDFRIIGNQYPDYFTNGQCGTAFVYNRVLSQAEILQNYNATKGRFGL
jgi:hypothetical protein